MENQSSIQRLDTAIGARRSRARVIQLGESWLD